jgi:alkylation response protein AidB-like acyl-CoA dehydrogenase
MTIGLATEHEALRDAVRGWAGRHLTRETIRQSVESAAEKLPACWEDLAAQGFLSPHLPEPIGGGGGLVELAVIAEEFGRALLPGPYLPTVLASAVLDRAAPASLRQALLPGLADGTRTAGVGLEPGLDAEWLPSGGLRIAGATVPVLGGARADVLLLPAYGLNGEVWFTANAGDLEIEVVPGLDPTRGLATVAADGIVIPAEQVLHLPVGPLVRELAAVLAAAEASGVADWCLHTAAEYAKIREQFGRPIGQFQAIKHKCAEMLLALEQARAAAWDAARAAESTMDPAQAASEPDDRAAALFATGVAAVLGPDAAVQCAKDCIQVLGGVGFTWEHDAHLYLRRAMSLRSFVGDAATWTDRVAELTLAGVRRPLEIELPAEAEALRTQIAAAAVDLAAVPSAGRRAALADGGWIAPHLPSPWGRDAGPVEQLVIQQEFASAGITVPDLVIGAWVVPTLIRYGTPEQREEFLPATLRGELTWCQLFSEPGAGSDLAALSTRGERVPGGWQVTGQKIWTSVAHAADWGICLIRTDRAAPKHRGLTYVLVDMRSDGIDVRPLRELTGRAMFNEVFLDDVFVPDSCVVGAPGDGWRLARTTLANERVALSTGWTQGAGVAELIALLQHRGRRPDAAIRSELGALVCQEQAFALLGLRSTLRRLSGIEPGPTSSARKLLGIRHAQRVAEYGWSLLGADGAIADGPAAEWPQRMLATRAMSIAGGTTEVQLNIIAERLLGLPRDP